MYFFVSSTFTDLRPEREKVQEILRQSDSLPWGMEFFVSEPHRTIDVCLNEVDRCDAVILLIGSRAGSLAPTPNGLTYTEAEIERARTRGLPVFAFVKLVADKLPNDHDRSDPLYERLNEFRDSLAAFVNPAYFDSLDHLGLHVLTAVTRWEREGRPGARRVFANRAEFFTLEAAAGRHLRHDVALQGRATELQALDGFIQGNRPLLILTAEGGAGKSKLLHDWTATLSDRPTLFVKPGATWHAEAAREVPAGDPVIIFDDAHQQPHLVKNLILLTGDLRHSGRNVKLLVATRPSGNASVDSAVSPRLAAADVEHLELRRLSLADRRQLAEEVLGPIYVHLRDHLVELAGETPLVIVVGGRLISTSGVDPGNCLVRRIFAMRC